MAGLGGEFKRRAGLPRLAQRATFARPAGPSARSAPACSVRDPIQTPFAAAAPPRPPGPPLTAEIASAAQRLRLYQRLKGPPAPLRPPPPPFPLAVARQGSATGLSKGQLLAARSPPSPPPAASQTS
jgi:hypothetical protein